MHTTKTTGTTRAIRLSKASLIQLDIMLQKSCYKRTKMKPEFDSRIGHHVTVELLQKKAEVEVSPAAEESSAPYVLVLI